MKAQEYTLLFLLDTNEDSFRYVFYGNPESAPACAKIIIVPSAFFESGVYGTKKTVPAVPFPLLPETDIPFLFGNPRLEKDSDGRLILYADLVASAYFMLSRYEEEIKPECRDLHGRFLAKDSVVFQQGYGLRPLVDEWGRYLQSLLRSCGVVIPESAPGFRKIYLTHDIDSPFMFWRKEQVCKQYIKNLIGRGKRIPQPYQIYRTGKNDPYYTFPRIREYDGKLLYKWGG